VDSALKDMVALKTRMRDQDRCIKVVDRCADSWDSS
jgi:hypothetical protein